jgi:predicted metal-dependent hydrolase
MGAQFELGETVVEVVQKNIKHLHLSVHPPLGRVRIAAPLRMDLETIRLYAVSRLSWIRKQQAKLQGQARETPRAYVTRESHYYMGMRYLLEVVEVEEAPKVVLYPSKMLLFVRPGTPTEKRKAVMDEWHRAQLKLLLPGLIAKWEPLMGVKVRAFAVKRMRTKWGTCNATAGRIWVNLELAKKPAACLEYIVVHEMVHLLVRNHNAEFVAYMDRFMPMWREVRDELNRLPFGHLDWGY